MGEGSFHLINRSCFHVKAENERFTTARSRCRVGASNLIYVSQRKYVEECSSVRATCSTIILRSTNDNIIDLWLCRCRRRRRFFNSLIWSLKSTTRRQRQRHKFFIFNEQRLKLCSPFTCLFSFLYISFPFSANLRRKMTISQVLQKTHSCAEIEFSS